MLCLFRSLEGVNKRTGFIYIKNPITFLLIFSSSSSCPWMKNGCWNSTGPSLSCFTIAESTWTTFLKPSKKEKTKSVVHVIYGMSKRTICICQIKSVTINPNLYLGSKKAKVWCRQNNGFYIRISILGFTKSWDSDIQCALEITAGARLLRFSLFLVNGTDA